MYEKALENRSRRTYECRSLDEIKESLKAPADGHGMALSGGPVAGADKGKAAPGVGSRCIPFEQKRISETCVCCGKPAKHMVCWAIAY